jgi:MoxR-like ATPase
MKPLLQEKAKKVLQTASGYVFGQESLLEGILAALICEGHLLIEGMPGLGKTFSINTMAKLCDLNFKRVQFTPDLLPSDLVGTMIYSQKSESFSTKFGPIFTQILLADEINRSPAKVQSALLEAMAEKQVTIGEETHKLSSPFVVLATQNPIDQEGTYPLPEAQLDRFMMKVNVDYPSRAAEKKVLELEKDPLKKISSMFSTDDIIDLQNDVASIHVDEKIKDLIVDIVQATRPGCDLFKKEYSEIVLAGASPRAVIWLYRVGKFTAYMAGKDFVTPEHIMKIVPDILGHRMILTYEAIVDGKKGKDVALKIAQQMI